MRRRTFITLLGGASAWPLAARSQQPAMPAVGFLGVARGPLRAQLAALHRALNEAGYVDGQNVQIEYRWAEGSYDRMFALAADLAARPVSVLLATGGDPGALAAKAATTVIPVVFIAGTDPVKLGLVASLSRPGGNATGVHLFQTLLEEKRVGLLREFLPSAATVAMLVNPAFPSTEPQVRSAREATGHIGMKLVVANAATESAFEGAFASLVEQRADALLVGADPFFNSRRDRIVALAAQHKLPAMYQVSSPLPAVSPATDRASPTRTARPAFTSPEFSRARSPLICRFCSRPSSSL
jgi:putative ABC transport system substrate-binding protein